LIAVRAYVALDKPGAGARLAANILKQVESLAKSPARGRPGRVDGTRELLVPPYLIPYRVVGDEIRILRVLHAAMRRPPEIP
jgi:plasmid stabilization system protein ParE